MVNQPPVLTLREQLDAHVDELVTLRGEVSNSKVPTIVGVEVGSDDPDLRGEEAEATGVLVRWTVTQAQLDAAIAERGMFAHRGPGTFYRLRNPDGGGTAPVRRVRR